jgi:hypothetical protein
MTMNAAMTTRSGRAASRPRAGRQGTVLVAILLLALCVCGAAETAVAETTSVEHHPSEGVGSGIWSGIQSGTDGDENDEEWGLDLSDDEEFGIDLSDDDDGDDWGFDFSDVAPGDDLECYEFADWSGLVDIVHGIVIWTQSGTGRSCAGWFGVDFTSSFPWVSFYKCPGFYHQNGQDDGADGWLENPLEQDEPGPQNDSGKHIPDDREFYYEPDGDAQDDDAQDESEDDTDDGEAEDGVLGLVPGGMPEPLGGAVSAAARVLSVRGAAERLVMRAGAPTWVRLRAGEELGPRAVVRTGLRSGLVLELHDGGQATVGAATKLGICAPPEGQGGPQGPLRVKYGAVRMSRPAPAATATPGVAARGKQLIIRTGEAGSGPLAASRGAGLAGRGAGVRGVGPPYGAEGLAGGGANVAGRALAGPAR